MPRTSLIIIVVSDIGSCLPTYCVGLDYINKVLLVCPNKEMKSKLNDKTGQIGKPYLIKGHF